MGLLNKSIGDKPVSFTQWIDSGRFIERDRFLGMRPDENLHVDCTDVVLYSGGEYIQLLKTGAFYLDPSTQSHKLKDVEVVLWDKKNNNNLNVG